jgi:hypothetical protein
VQVDGGWSKTLSAMAARRRQGLSDESFRQLPADCPPGLVRVLTKCLLPQPEDRWDNGKELATQLEFCSNREVQDLLHPPASRWKSKFGKWPLLFVFLAVGIPNGLAAWLNFEFNNELMSKNTDDHAMKAFMKIVTVVNSIAFPVGLGTLIYLTHLIVRGVQQMRQGEMVESRHLGRIRWLALFLGHLSAVIGSVEWAIAGLTYPVSMQLMSVEIAPAMYAQFFGSLVVCGLIAAAYPFFGVTYMGLGILYPGLLLDDLSATNDVPKLKRLGWYALVYLIIAATVPLLGVLSLLTLEWFSNLKFDETFFRITLAALSVGGMLGFGLLFWRYRVLQRELDVLIGALLRNS